MLLLWQSYAPTPDLNSSVSPLGSTRPGASKTEKLSPYIHQGLDQLASVRK